MPNYLLAKDNASEINATHLAGVFRYREVFFFEVMSVWDVLAGTIKLAISRHIALPLWKLSTCAACVNLVKVSAYS